MSLPKLRIGDIVLFRGQGIIGKTISMYTGGPYSHVAMYVGNFRGKPMVIEAWAGGVRYTLLEKKQQDFIVRRSHLGKKTLEKIVSSATEDINKGYDYRGLFGFIISDQYWRRTGKRVPYEDSHKLFCSELIKHHYEHSGLIDLTGKPSWVTSPYDLFLTPLLHTIYDSRIHGPMFPKASFDQRTPPSKYK